MSKLADKRFHEQLNSDGTLDLLCLVCRALVGENLSETNLPGAREAHRCRARALFIQRQDAPGRQRAQAHHVLHF